VKHRATDDFWAAYDKMPRNIQRIADKSYLMLKTDASHPSLHFKPVANFWSARVSREYRALAVKRPDGFSWFWIGHHKEYEWLIKGG
jgi:hypothetical protein